MIVSVGPYLSAAVVGDIAVLSLVDCYYALMLSRIRGSW